MNYRSTSDFLHERGNEVQQIHLGLHRISAVMQAFGNPQARFPALHIAGTNGKGSVAAMAEAVLRTSGMKTGLYTSPHLVRIEERIRVSGRQIPRPGLARLITRIESEERRLIRTQLMDRPLTYFEVITACAFLYFAQQEIDIAVIEVGLGGLLDATNIIKPRVSVITGIAFDHEALLGNTLEKIAAEKAGIIKPGVPVVTGCRPRAALRVLREKARLEGAPLSEIRSACDLQIKRGRRGHVTIDLRTPVRLYRNLTLALAGDHQARNAALAVRAVELLRVPIDAGIVKRALAGATWPGRLDEYPARRRTLLDGAHNPEGAALLREHLQKQKRASIHLVFGTLRDKAIAAIARQVFPLAETIHLAPIANTRSAQPAQIAALFARHSGKFRIYNSSRAALRGAWETCPPNGLVVVTGSLYLIGELLPLVRRDAKR